MSQLKNVTEATHQLGGYLEQLLNEDITDGSAIVDVSVRFIDSGISSGDASLSFMALFMIFVLACFIGFYVVWSVTPALHSPLMSVTNAISSVIIVGGLIAVGSDGIIFSQVMGFLAVTLAAVNIFGGFVVTDRMLGMFKKKARG